MPHGGGGVSAGDQGADRLEDHVPQSSLAQPTETRRYHVRSSPSLADGVGRCLRRMVLSCKGAME
ncbi:MAG: hypothetical protein IH941_12965 [Acidobacteria bacterium]|nr:hypothetical protein [Acidobacteriota bacterium]